jgi:hypothetical protein
MYHHERGPSPPSDTLDIQALAQRSVRLPQLRQADLAAGDLVPVSACSPYIDHDPEFQAAERARRWREALLREQVQQTAYHAVRDALEAETVTGQVIRDLDHAVERAVQAKLRADAEPEPAAEADKPQNVDSSAPEPEPEAAS